MNEISFSAWGGGDVGYLNPFARGRGGELKRQLARAAILGMDGVREVRPDARFLHAEPLIHVTASLNRPDVEGEQLREAVVGEHEAIPDSKAAEGRQGDPPALRA